MSQQKPRGYFEFALAMDCETTGLFFGQDDPSYNPETKQEHQAVAWGFNVVRISDFKTVEEDSFLVKWNGVAQWSEEAEKVHGLTKDYLEDNGIEEVEAAERIGNLILKYWGPNTNTIPTLGQHVSTFDLWFLKRMTRRHGLDFKYGNRHIDTWSVGLLTLKAYNSDDLFNYVGLPPRGIHSALEDTRNAVEAMRRIHKICGKVFDDD